MTDAVDDVAGGESDFLTGVILYLFHKGNRELAE